MILTGVTGEPLVSSHPIGIRGVVFQQHAVRSADLADAARDYPLIDFHLGPPQAVEFRAAAEGPWRKGAAGSGSLTVTPARSTYNVRWKGVRELLLFAIDLDVCREYLPEMLPRSGYSVRAVTNADDPQLMHLALAFQAEAKAGCPSGRIYADSIAAAFVASFVDRYVERPPGRDTGGLSFARLRQVTDYIQEHLEDDLSVAVLARLARTSPSHFWRQFKRRTGLPPHQFVLRRRLDKARRLLEHGDLSIAEVAYATGFPNQAHFTTLFRRSFGETPKTWRSRRRN